MCACIHISKHVIAIAKFLCNTGGLYSKILCDLCAWADQRSEQCPCEHHLYGTLVNTCKTKYHTLCAQDVHVLVITQNEYGILVITRDRGAAEVEC